MIAVANRLGWPVVIDPDLARQGLVYDGTIYVRPAYEPRLDFTVAHELMEIYLPDQIKCEATCNRGAAAMLLPWNVFLNDLARCQLELPELKQLYPRASFSALGRRLVDLCPGVAVTKWIDGIRTWCRTVNLGAEITEAEHVAVEQLHATKTKARAKAAVGDDVSLAWTVRRRPMTVLTFVFHKM